MSESQNLVAPADDNRAGAAAETVALEIQQLSLPPSINTHEVARTLLEAGYSCFAGKAFKKTPATPNGFKDAVSEPALMTSAFQPGQNVMLACGQAYGGGLIVFDFDAPKTNGMEPNWMHPGSAFGKFKKMFIKRCGEYAWTEFLNGAHSFRVTTPRLGFHIYGCLPAGVIISSGTGIIYGDDGTSMDIRCEGAYVVGPWSVTSEHRDGDGEIKQAAGVYQPTKAKIPNRAEVPIVPSEMIALLQELRGAKPTAKHKLCEQKAVDWIFPNASAHGFLATCPPHGRVAAGSGGLGSFSDGERHDPFILLAKIIVRIDRLNQKAANDPSFQHPYRSRNQWFFDTLFPLAHTAANKLGITPAEAEQILELVSRYDAANFIEANFVGSDDLGQLHKAIENQPEATRTAATIHANAKPWSLADKPCISAIDKARELAPDLAAQYDECHAELARLQQANVERAKAAAKLKTSPAMTLESKQPEDNASLPTIPIFKPEPPIYERPAAQTASMTLQGGVSRFPFIRNIAGKLRVMDLQDKSSTMLVKDFAEAYGTEVEVTLGVFKPIGRYLKDNRAARIETDSVGFFPRVEPGVIVRNGREYWNLYNGIDMEKVPPFSDPAANCPLILAYIRDVLNHPDVDGTGYIQNYMAWCVQNIAEKSGVAIVLRGEKGGGKSTYNQLMCKLFAPHSMIISKSAHVFGRFNSHLEEMLFVGLEEALWADNGEEADGAKDLITGSTIMLEKKYVNAKEVPSYLNLGITTNHDRAAPVTKIERRYMVGDVPLGIYSATQWDALYKEINGNGVAALWQVLKAHQLPAGWHPRDHIPQNTALAKQKLLGLGATVEGWLFDLLGRDSLPGAYGVDWDAGVVEIVGKPGKDAMRDDAKTWQKNLPGWQKRAATFTDREIILVLKRAIGVTMGTGGERGRDKTWIFPDRQTCINNFEKDQHAVGGVGL